MSTLEQFKFINTRVYLNKGKICTEFPLLTVRYDKSVEELLKLWPPHTAVAPGINTDNFPINEGSEAERIPVLVDFGPLIMSEKAVAMMNRMGLFSADMHGLLEFGIEHPYEYFKYHIVALGSPVLLHKEWFVPYLTGNDPQYPKRRVNLHIWGGGWDDSDRLLTFKFSKDR